METQVAESMKEDSLLKTVSRAGTWVNRMGLRDRAWIAGRDREVCGWAVPESELQARRLGER